MRRAFSTLGCAELALEDVLALAARHGIPCVELRALEGAVELPGLFERRYGSPERLAARLAEAPVRVAAIGTSLRLIGNGPGDRDAFLRFLPWAEAMGVDSLRVFDGGRIGDPAGLEEASLACRAYPCEGQRFAAERTLRLQLRPAGRRGIPHGGADGRSARGWLCRAAEPGMGAALAPGPARSGKRPAIGGAEALVVIRGQPMMRVHAVPATSPGA